MQVYSINNQNNSSFSGLLTIKKETNMLQNIYKMGIFKNQKLTNVTLNTDFIESVESLTNKKAAIQNNIIINMINGIRYKITGCMKDTFVKAYNKAHINNSEEFFGL